MAETRVDLLHLLEDLRDAYPGSIEETILTEIIANSVDAGASRIRIATSPAEATLTITDDGSGMPRRDLRRYHDLAASTKTRGRGIGFAGVGIKLALLVCKEVVTETRRGKVHIATTWHLASRNRAPWKWIPPRDLPDARAPKRPVRLGLAVQFEERPGGSELGRLVESTVFVNRSHPAYQRAAASRSEGYHIALSVALALAPLAVEPAGEHVFVTTFLSRWGEAVSGRAVSPRR